MNDFSEIRCKLIAINAPKTYLNSKNENFIQFLAI